MKTLLIYNSVEDELKYLILDGDYSKFHGVVLQAITSSDIEKEFNEFFYNIEDGSLKFELSSDKSLIENKNWDKIAIVTWLP